MLWFDEKVFLGEVFDSMQVEFDADDCDLNLADVEDLVGHHDLGDDDLGLEDLDDDLEEEEEITDDEDEDDDMEGYEYPIGPMPQEVTNDLKSLDEMVSLVVKNSDQNSKRLFFKNIKLCLPLVILLLI